MKIKQTFLVMFIALISYSAVASKKVLPSEAKTRMMNILEENEKLHRAFVNYDGAKVEKASKALKEKVSLIENKDLVKKLAFSIKKLAAIKASNDREVNNKNYHSISLALLHIIDTFELGSKYIAYECNMVHLKWIQNSEKLKVVNNPYMGENMLMCGGKVE